ncbi:MAG: efflux RND transporter periplasmic adaptor subunit [Halioglobus sp.]|nr:efflux RND transporter periplasmic adaptor subunit [Halioglobus sp.]
MRTLRNPLQLIACLMLVLAPVGHAQRATPPVTVEAVQEVAVRESIRLTGSVTAVRASNLSPATSGLITALEVDAGSRVKRGDLLLELDPELARWQAQSAAATARAARAALDDARRRLAEARTLAPKQSIAETLVRGLAAEVAEDEAALQRAQAEAGYREGILARHRLHAPYDGVVAAKLSEVGEWVVPGDAVLELVATGELRIDFAVAERYLQRMAPATRVTFTVAAAEAPAGTGTVATVVPISDPGARTFLLRVEPDDDGPALSPGMSVSGRLLLDAGRRAPAVSRDAIIRHPDGRVIVWTVEDTGDEPVVRERIVEPGLAFDGLVEIKSGLAPGTLVVVNGNEALQVGQRVTVQRRPE